jgi:hypothetical protein
VLGPGITLAQLVLAAVLLVVTDARAAGGHHAVEDAAILEAGQCQVETWLDRVQGGGRRLLHLGSACRLGPVEAGLNLDGVRLPNGTTRTIGPQVKWTTRVTPTLGIGVVASTSWQEGAANFVGSTLVVPMSWQVHEGTAIHLNVGRDLRRRASDATRAGIAVEWIPLSSVALIAERFHEGGGNFWRTGARWLATPALSLDISRAAALDGSSPAWWTVGLNIAFGM